MTIVAFVTHFSSTEENHCFAPKMYLALIDVTYLLTHILFVFSVFGQARKRFPNINKLSTVTSERQKKYNWKTITKVDISQS